MLVTVHKISLITDTCCQDMLNYVHKPWASVPVTCFLSAVEEPCKLRATCYARRKREPHPPEKKILIGIGALVDIETYIVYTIH